MSKFGAIGLRPCQSAVNTTRKPSRGLATLRVKIWCDRGCDRVKVLQISHENRAWGLATLRVKIWCDRAATVSKCCKYHTKKLSRGLATLRVKIWCDRAATVSKCCKYHTKCVSKFGAIGLRPCQSAVNTTRKPSRGLATLRVKIWCDRAATVSKCCKYHTKTAGRGLATLRVKIWCDRAATVSKCCKYHTKTEQGFSNFACQNLVRSGCDRVKVL